MKNKKVLFFFIILILPFYLNAQELVLNGTVEDADNEPIELVNITVMDMDSILISGGVTNVDGKFSIALQKKSNYILSFSYLGFQSKQITLKGVEASIDIGSIVLEEMDKTLSEVVVTAKQQINQLEKSLIFPTEIQKKHASDGFGLLNNLMIPQIHIDLQNKQVTARSNKVTLLINGRPITNNAEITGLRPQDILRVEYHDMPSGLFAEYESAVNFITRQYTYGGYFGLDGTQNMTYDKGDYLAMARMNRGKSEYSLVYSFDYMRDKKSHRDISEEFIYPDNDILYRTETGLPSIEKNQTHQIYFDFNYRTDSIQTSIKIGYKNRQSPDNQFLSTQVYEGKLNLLNNLTEWSTEKSSSPYLSFYSNLNLKNNQNIRFIGSVDYSKNSYNRYYEERIENEQSKSLKLSFQYR